VLLRGAVMRKRRYKTDIEYTVISDKGVDKVSKLRQHIFIRICMAISLALIALGILAIINP
jgi:hypothetical protein